MTLTQKLFLIGAAGLFFQIGCGRTESPTSETALVSQDQNQTTQSSPVRTAAAQTALPESVPAPGTIHVRPLDDDAMPLPAPPGEDDWNAGGCVITVPHSGKLTVTARLAKGRSFGGTSWIGSPGQVKIAFGLVKITGEELLNLMDAMLTAEEQHAFLESVPDFERRFSYRMNLVVDSDISDDSGASHLRSNSSTVLRGVPEGASLSQDRRDFATGSPLVIEEEQEAAIAVWVFGPGVSSDGPTTVSHAFDVNQRRYDIRLDEYRYSLDDYPHPFVELVISWIEAGEPSLSSANTASD